MPPRVGLVSISSALSRSPHRRFGSQRRGIQRRGGYHHGGLRQNAKRCKLAHARRLLGGGSPASELASAFGRSRRGFRRLAARPSQSPLPWLRVWLSEGGREGVLEETPGRGGVGRGLWTFEGLFLEGGVMYLSL
ncbi:MAG: hypothetical protein LM566_03100 [Pyrobaculum sp.]|nr:hypothetical protein [Pyrobaculum sp.]